MKYSDIVYIIFIESHTSQISFCPGMPVLIAHISFTHFYKSTVYIIQNLYEIIIHLACYTVEYRHVESASQSVRLTHCIRINLS